ncbi:hypothetical protein SteCoe_27845 [Stentor coeruleus]|uniref:THH1/TOM1/TOM3 domain-containing protein n=1 Tax=Stentor coeruleus TaxID=5963 RepID=A0A1R2B9K2_9CILI|nr:hypothetical protein SteCoe_27845 [Stentor coeruleus]
MIKFQYGSAGDLGTVNISIFLSLFVLVIFLAIAKAIPSIIYLKARYNIKILWFYIIITIAASFRICWCLNYFFGSSRILYHLLESLCTGTLEVLGYTFLKYWIDAYIELSLKITYHSKRQKLYIMNIVYFLISCSTYILHILYVTSPNLSLTSYSVDIYIDSIISMLVSISLIISSKLFIKQLKNVFSVVLSAQIISRIKKVLLSNVFIYLSKSILFISSANITTFDSHKFHVMFMYFYLIGTEILPLCSVLYFLKANVDKSPSTFSGIPSVLIAQSDTDSRIRDLFRTFMKESTYEYSNDLKYSSLSNPVLELDHVEEERINLSHSLTLNYL